jgi:hypothetical protein
MAAIASGDKFSLMEMNILNSAVLAWLHQLAPKSLDGRRKTALSVLIQLSPDVVASSRDGAGTGTCIGVGGRAESSKKVLR